MKTILVTNKDYWETPVTVTRTQGDELVWCNHANVTEDVHEDVIYRANGGVSVHNVTISTCNKCEAYRFDYDDYWQDAPIEGVR